MTFDEFVSAYLPEGAKEYLRESLKTGKSVHLYGEQGTGKSFLCEQFRRNGFTQVTEPGMDSFDILNCRKGYPYTGPYVLPLNIRDMALIEFHGIRKPLPVWKRFTREEIEEWIMA